MFVITRTWNMDKFNSMKTLDIVISANESRAQLRRSNILDSANQARKLMNVSQNPSEL